MNFEDLKLTPALSRSIADRGYSEMTEVQQKTLPRTLAGIDVAVQSQTGTGKTAAFLITLFERFLKKTDSPKKKALIIVPTRELAVQIQGEAELLNHHTDFVVGSFYGGVGYNDQLTLLREGVDILIGTPGRLIDLSARGDLRLREIGFLVIDEADRLFDMGFLPDIRKILRKMPNPKARQSMLFSATLNRVSRMIADDFLNDPEFIEVTPEQLTVDTISQELYHVGSHIKMNLLLGLLERHKPQTALIFTNMRYQAQRVSHDLQLNGFRSRHLTGDLPQPKRLRVINDFMDGRFGLLVATDVAARGLHIDDLEMVINYDIPQDFENYVHRIGRTARAGKEGIAISLANEGTRYNIEAIEKFIGMKIPVKTADSELYATDRSLEFPEKKESRDRGRKPSPGRNRPRSSNRPKSSKGPRSPRGPRDKRSSKDKRGNKPHR